MTVFLKPPAAGQGPEAASRAFLRRLLESEAASAVLVDVVSDRQSLPQRRLVHDADSLQRSLPFAPLMLASGARLAAQLTDRRPSRDGARSGAERRCAIVLRPCEARATVELSKLKQVDLGQLLIIAVDCIGTHEAAAYAELALRPDAWAERYLEAMRDGLGSSPFPQPYREACNRCVDPVAPAADVWLHVIGVPPDQDLVIEVRDEGLADRLGLEQAGDAAGRDPAVSRLRSTREDIKARELEAALASLQPQGDGLPGLAAVFDSCLRCLNCGTACPICYCKECLFRTDSLRVECRHLFDLAERRGAVRLPGDAILYQLTRLMHVSTSCVGCGLCTSACPMDLPVDRLFQSVGRETQALLSYRPGVDAESPIPASTFVREEFEWMGER